MVVLGEPKDTVVYEYRRYAPSDGCCVPALRAIKGGDVPALRAIRVGRYPDLGRFCSVGAAWYGRGRHFESLTYLLTYLLTYSGASFLTLGTRDLFRTAHSGHAYKVD